ncbi:Zn-dependent alcohol dehydrogenase [Pseudonocardia ailaonensis]|uniref:Zn-dependent alcohol dehydrogenase n=1 Tax=Pseudonocardia ailaonensis TaxID=367279 RepID=A0ABN2N079_9PSEU
MRAVIFDGGSTKLCEDVEVRAPGIGEVSVRVHASGVCQSDLSVIKGSLPFPVPVVLGHEGAGVVEEVGPGVTGLAVGDHIVLSTLANCGVCPACVTGRPGMCRSTFGITETPFQRAGEPLYNFAALSTFSDRIVVRAGQAVSIPKQIPFASACLIGCCVLTGAGAVFNRANVQVGESVAVIGAGGVGLNVIQAARLAGAASIIAIDANPEKEADARRFGATAFVDPRETDAVRAVRDLTRTGVAHVFECVGHPDLVSQAVEMTDWHGQVILLGVAGPGAELSVPMSALYLDKSILGCRYGSSRPAADVARYVELYGAGRLLLDELITRTYPLEAYEDAIEDLRAGKLNRGVLQLT